MIVTAANGQQWDTNTGQYLDNANTAPQMQAAVEQRMAMAQANQVGNFTPAADAGGGGAAAAADPNAGLMAYLQSQAAAAEARAAALAQQQREDPSAFLRTQL